MKKIFLLLILAASSLSSCSQGAEKHQKQQGVTDTELAASAAVPSYAISLTHPGDSARIVSLLAESRGMAGDENTIIHYAQRFLGLPYVAFTLDQNDEEALVINTEGLDCTTYVENVMALAWCASRKIYDFKGFCDVLAQVRYIGGKVAYTTRQHYFTTWISSNITDGLVSEFQLPAPPLSAKRKARVNYMTTHVEAYRMLNAHRQWLQAIKEMEQDVCQTEFVYIPKDQLRNSDRYRDYIHDGDIIGIVTNKAGLDISHVGFARWHSDGLHMMHASSLRKKVIDDPTSLYDYLQKQKSAVGIRVVRVNL